MPLMDALRRLRSSQALHRSTGTYTRFTSKGATLFKYRESQRNDPDIANLLMVRMLYHRSRR